MRTRPWMAGLGLLALIIALPTARAASSDFDGDGVADSSDMDDDNDGVPDFSEPLLTDNDGDGADNHQDLDADGDGV